MSEPKKEKIFPDGVRFELPKEGVPEWIIGKVSIKVEPFIKWLQEYVSETGWVNLDLKVARDKEVLYFELNQWKKKDAPKRRNPLKEFLERNKGKEENIEEEVEAKDYKQNQNNEVPDEIPF